MDEQICGRCLLPIHRDEARDYYGDHCNHKSSRCVELLHMRLAEAEKKLVRYEALVDAFQEDMNPEDNSRIVSAVDAALKGKK